MSATNRQGMLAETIRRLTDDEGVAVDDLAVFCGVAASTVYRWREGRDPGAHNLMQLMRHTNPLVARRVISAVVAGTRFVVAERREGNLDVDGDGVVSLIDALHIALQTDTDASCLAQEVLQAIQDGRYDDFELAKLEARITDIQSLAADLLDAVAQSRDCQFKHRSNKRPSLVGAK